jgi:hypothetical protein
MHEFLQTFLLEWKDPDIALIDVINNDFQNENNGFNDIELISKKIAESIEYFNAFLSVYSIHDLDELYGSLLQNLQMTFEWFTNH